MVNYRYSNVLPHIFFGVAMKSLFFVFLVGGLIIASQQTSAACDPGKAVSATTISDDVAVRATGDEKGAVVATLKKGAKLTASDRVGAYWKVKLADGKEGFVSVTSIKTHGSVKNLVKGAAAPASADCNAAPAPSPAAKAKSDADAKAAAAKADADAKAAAAKADIAAKAAAAKAAITPPAAPAAAPAAAPEANAKKLEKAAGGLFKKK
jgi:Bacterial SH3 domain